MKTGSHAWAIVGPLFLGVVVMVSVAEVTAPAKEASVRPGINERFLDPNLNIEEWVQRWEVESREIYVERDEILRRCGLRKGMQVADVGAGTGLFTRKFSTAVGEEGWVYAVDIAPRFLEHVNAWSRESGRENVTGVLCRGDSVNLPPESVDMAFVCATFHHFEYPVSSSKSIHRALRKGGSLVVIDFERIPGKSREWVLGHVRAGKDVFKKEILEAGFTFEEEIEIPGFTENYFLRFRKK